MDKHVSWRDVADEVCLEDNYWPDLEAALVEYTFDQAIELRDDPESYEWFDPKLYIAECEMLEVPELAIDTMLESVLYDYHDGAKFSGVEDLKAFIKEWNSRQKCFNFTSAARIDFSGYPWQTVTADPRLLSSIAARDEKRVNSLAKIISEARFRWNNEKDLQDGLEQLFQQANIRCQREAQLSKGVVDFLVGSVGVEVKIKGQMKAVLSQLRRYAEDPQITALVLVTGRIQLTNCPDRVGGKPLRVVPLVGSLF